MPNAARLASAHQRELFDALARCGRSRGELGARGAEALAFPGAAASRVRAGADRVAAISERYPDAASYRPGDIL